LWGGGGGGPPHPSTATLAGRQRSAHQMAKLSVAA
jgi:hypothetical protein